MHVLEAAGLSATVQPVTFNTLPGRLELMRRLPLSSVAITVIVMASPGAKLGLLAATWETPGSWAIAGASNATSANAVNANATNVETKRRRRGIVDYFFSNSPRLANLTIARQTHY